MRSSARGMAMGALAITVGGVCVSWQNMAYLMVFGY